MVDWFVNALASWLVVGWLIVCVLVGVCLFSWWVGWLVVCLAGRLFGWLVGWLVVCLAGRLVGWFVGLYSLVTLMMLEWFIP